MGMLLRDARHALRGLGRTPGFTAIVLMTVALGTGVNAAVFSVLNALVLRPADGVTDPAGFVAAYTSDYSSGPFGSTSYADFQSMKEDGAFSAIAAYTTDTTVLAVGNSAERVGVSRVSADFFGAVGVRATMERFPGAAGWKANVAVVSDRLWRRTFASDPGIVGRTVTIGDRPFDVVGVAPPEFAALDLGSSVDVWTPLVPSPNEGRGDRGYSVIGRLAPGVSLDQAGQRMTALAATLAREFPTTNQGTLERPDEPRGIVVRRHNRLDPASRAEIGMTGAGLMTATMLVLLIACANVAGLLLARSASRRREIAVRLALGAGRLRIVRQLLTESIVIGLAGGAFGLLVALWSIRALPAFFPPEQARLIDARIAGPELVFALAVSLTAGLLFGLAPVLHTRRWSRQLSMRGGVSEAPERHGALRARSTLVAAQVALACVLLVSTGLLAKSLTKMLGADLGFEARDAVVASVEMPPALTSEAQGAEYYRSVLNAIRRLPGVQEAALVSALPMQGTSRRGFRMVGYTPQPGEDLEQRFLVADVRYFETLQIPVVAGRAFDDRDRATSARVAIVNEAFANRYFGGHALGAHIVDSRRTDMEIVGVVKSGPYLSVRDAPTPFVYYPLAQSYLPDMSIVARTSVDPVSMVEPLRRAVHAVRPDVAVYRVMTLESNLAEAFAADRLSASLVSACSVLATLLAAVGVYGVMAYSVLRRAREIGVRIALGAEPRQIVRLVLKEGLTLAVAGVSAGLIGAALAGRFLSSFLYGVRSTDVTVFLAAPFVLGLMVVLAGIVPIRRAVHVDPMVVLRQD